MRFNDKCVIKEMHISLLEAFYDSVLINILSNPFKL